MTARLRVVSLFSGAGGFDWGLHLTSGFVTCLANELKLVPAQTMARNLNMRLARAPASPRVEDEHMLVQGDIAQMSFSNLNGLEPDVLIGGPPCQDFSVIKGSVRRGVEVKRGKLYSHFVRALVALQPKVFVFENVPGLLSANGHLAYEMILQDFQNLNMRWHEIHEAVQTDNGDVDIKKLGFEILFAGIVDASKLGVPQKRRRLVVVGIRQDLANKVGLFGIQQIRTLLTQQMSGVQCLVAKYPVTCIEVFEGKPLCELGKEYKDAMLAYEGIWEDVPTPVAQAWKEEVWEKLSLDVLSDYLLVNGIAGASSSEIKKAMSEHCDVLSKLGYLGLPVRELRSEDGTNIVQPQSSQVTERMQRIPPDRNNEFVSGTRWEVEGRGLSLIYRRAFPLKPAPTVVAYGGGGTWGYHYERDRGVLTNRERARLQTFTDNFLFVGSVSEVRAQIGEAVPPLLAEKVGEVLLEVLSSLTGRAVRILEGQT